MSTACNNADAEQMAKLAGFINGTTVEFFVEFEKIVLECEELGFTSFIRNFALPYG